MRLHRTERAGASAVPVTGPVPTPVRCSDQTL